MSAVDSVAVVFDSGSVTEQATLPVDVRSYSELLAFVRQAFKQPQLDCIISDGQNDICSDEQLQQLQPGQRLLVRPKQSKEMAVFKERISFNPHPKTLTMAGDYEYFAAQGHAPLAFALAELIDNALRATKGNRDQPRSITISLVTDDKASKGMVCVRDNGCGMTVQELNKWAVMNLSMEDRGLLHPEEGKAGNRYLSSDISYFGVGSKNAAFYLGKTVKVVTKTNDSSYVHELCIQASELERRYREGQAVYEEDMLHRLPGDAASLAACEQSFPLAQELLSQEMQEDHSAAQGSFTRVLIYDLKPEVLAELCDEDDGAGILRDLAHLYHYYLHGAKGNQFTTSHAAELPNGEKVPDVIVERLQWSAQCWQENLVEVRDDLESKYLKAQRSQLEFELTVPNYGKVEGVLWYFPFENDEETVPLDPHTLGRMTLSSHKDGASQPPGHGPLTQMAQSQLPQMAASQRSRASPEQDANYSALLAACPTFEAFWQGRLIPGSCVDTLPFIRNVRMKRTAAARDLLPDEVFSRIRGALFFGPGFRVTRNKLTFRDNLAQLLETASPTNRQLEKLFKEWLSTCHRELDRSVRFEVMCNQSLQAQARKHLGQDVTIFERMNDGLQTINKGDVVRLNTKPAILGRVLHFSIPQVVQSEGCYSGGRVTVCALPAEVLGADNLHTWPLRRLEGLATAEEQQEHVDRELSKLPQSLRLEPLRLASGSVLSMPAGSSLPETSISVMNGAGNKIVKGLIGGHRQQLRVVQTLYYLGPAGSARKRTAAAASQGDRSAPLELTAADLEAAVTAAAQEAAGAAGKKGGKRGKRRKKGGATAEPPEKENEQPVGVDGMKGSKAGSPPPAEVAQDDVVPEGEVLLSHENKSPIQESFQFQRITGGITRAGCYCLQYSLIPELPGGRTLRYTVDLLVSAGPPVSFDIQGVGRAIAVSKSIMLGEALPPLRLQLQDSYGNVVPATADTWADKQVQLQMLQGSLAAGGSVIQELLVEAKVEVQADELCLNYLRVLGPNPPSPGSTGMQLFKPPAAASAPGPASVSQHCAAAGPAVTLPVVRSVDVFLAVHIEGLPPQGFPVRLAPGVPNSLRLLHGHPFCATATQQEDQLLLTQLVTEQQLAPAEVISGDNLPTFKVQTLDVWGNPTCPNDALVFEVALECAAADADSSSFTVDDRGVATISGVSIQRQPSAADDAPEASVLQQAHQLLLWPQCGEVQQPLMQPAVDAAQPQQQLGLQLLVLPSNKPARLHITHHGQELESRTQPGDTGEPDQVVWLLSDVEAGSRVDGLSVCCEDEVGRPAEAGIQGRIQVSWAKGSKKATLGSSEIRLPGLPAPDNVGHPQLFWVRFTADQKQYPGVTFDINFEVSVVPGPPYSWSIAIIDYQKGQAAAAKAAQPKDAEGNITCGQPFYMELEVIDQCHNRCSFTSGEHPVPVMEVTPEDQAAELQLDPTAWKKKWDQTQAGGDVCLYKLWVAGPPGQVRLRVRDNAGEDGACLLQEDELLVTLLAGPPAALMVDCAQQLECGTRGLLESLPVKCVDCYGNVAEGAAFEVSLSTSALNEQGNAARVSAKDSNRTTLRKGVATFKNVRIQAQSDGVYKLTIGAVSRKHVVQEAMITAKITQQNYVCNLQVLPSSVPASSTVGCKLQLLVSLDTEDQQPVSWDILTSSIHLALTPPTVEAVAVTATSKGRKAAAAARKADVVTLVPAGLWDPQQSIEGLEPAAVEAAAAAAARGCVVWFSSEELLLAGQYTVTAEYVESREQLLLGLSKQEQTIRSTSLQFDVAAGPVSTAELTAAGADQETLTISNGKEASQRRLLRNAAVQLQDSYNNPAAVPEVPVRIRLLVSDAAAVADDEAEAPQLCCSVGETQLKTDENGRAFFGDVGVEQDTGRMPSGSLQCDLEVQVLVPRPKGRRSSSSSSNWVTVWNRQVVFSDDAARIRDLQALQEQKEQLQQQLTNLKESMQEVHQRITAAQQEHQTASKAANKQLNTLKEKLRATGLQLPSNSSEAQKLLEQLQRKAGQQPDRPVLEARYGNPRHPVSLAITKLLQLGDPELVGVFAQLGHVNEPKLSAVLAANYASSLQVMVVKSYEAITRLRTVAQEQHMHIPSMTSYSLIQEYVPEGPASAVQMSGISDLAQQLVDEACRGTDAPLPIPLPHTRSLCILQNQGKALPSGLAADQWPEGCLGYSVNLVRPAISNSRKGVMFAQLGRTLVFETVDQGAQYRQYAIKALRASVPDIVTLCGGKLSGRGVVVGSGFRVCSIEEAQCRFGSISAGHHVTGHATALTQCTAATEAVVEALGHQEASGAELESAQAAAAAEEHQQLEQQQAELQQQLKELSAQIRKQQHSIEGDSKKGGRAGRQTQQAEEPPQDDPTAADGAAEASDEAPPQQDSRQHRSKRRRH